MNRHVENAYVSEIVNQCESAISAGMRMNEALEAQSRPVVFFQHAQAFVVHVAALSRIFWPPHIRDQVRKGVAAARADHLRRQLGIVSPHTLENRDLRNHIEHFDERLDDWASSSTSLNHCDLNIMPLGAVGGLNPSDNFRQFDPATKIFHFRGDAFDVQALATAVSVLLVTANARLDLLRQNP